MFHSEWHLPNDGDGTQAMPFCLRRRVMEEDRLAKMTALNGMREMVRTHTSTHICTHMYTYMYTRTHTHTRLSFFFATQQ